MRETIEKIIAEAVWAPSGDNTQPWQFSIHNDELSVYCMPEKDNPILNFHFSGTYISAGAVLENIIIISKHYGYGAKIRYFPDTQNHKLVAKIIFEKAIAEDEPLYHFIKRRHTNRKPYKSIPVTDAEKKELLRLSSVEISIRLIDNKQERKKIGTACSITERIALETEELHRLFFESLVWSLEEEIEKGRGLHVKSLELPPPILGLFKIVKNWPIVKLFNRVGFSRLASKGNAGIYSGSPMLGAIVIKNRSLLEFVRVGQVFQRFWLTATKLGLSLQPVTGTVFFFQRLEANDTDVFSPHHVEMIKRAYKDFQNIYKIKDKEMIAMHFRIGQSDKASYRSSRVAPKMMSSSGL